MIRGGELLKGRTFRTGICILFVALIGLAGCVGEVQSNGTPSSNTALTQMAQQVEILRNELDQVAPTLTALIRVLSTVTAIPPAVGLQGEKTVSPIPAVETLTPRPAIINPSSIPWRISATFGTPGVTVEATRPMIVVNGELTISTPTPYTPAESILYQDDFSNNRGWFTASTARYVLKINNGSYRFTVAAKDFPVWSVRGIDGQDVRIEVDAAQLGGPADGYYGLVCRHVDDKNYYILVVSVDGAFGIGKVKEKELRYLAFTNEYNSLINQDGNRLRADCIGDTLTLYVDDIKVLETKDSDFAEGSAGMVVGNRDIPGTDVLFDNYLVLKS